MECCILGSTDTYLTLIQECFLHNSHTMVYGMYSAGKSMYTVTLCRSMSVYLLCQQYCNTSPVYCTTYDYSIHVSVLRSSITLLEKPHCLSINKITCFCLVDFSKSFRRDIRGAGEETFSFLDGRISQRRTKKG